MTPPEDTGSRQFAYDPLLPPEMARRAETIGMAKARLDAVSLLTLAVLAGAFIALGAVFMTTTLAGTAGDVPYGISRLLGGGVFALGLILVVIGGAKLFTGNNLMVMAWASRRITGGALLRSWSLAYIGNFAGACGTAILVYLAGHHLFGQGAVGLLIKWFADATFWQAIGASPEQFATITVGGAVRNLVSVTLGNMVGGGGFVVAVYWFAYLRKR